MTTRTSRAITTCLALVVSTLLPACDSAGLYPVTGSVIYKGKPATGAAVHFRREGASAEEETTFPIGLVDADGHFTLEVNGVGSGAKPGKYKVLVLWKPEQDLNAPVAKSGRSKPTDRKNPKLDTDRLKYRYFKSDQPLLTAEVKPEANKLEPFELKD